MPLPSSGIIVVEKPSSASITRINNSTTSNTIKSSVHPSQDQEQQAQIQYYEYYDVHENQLSQRQTQQQQKNSTIVVDATLFHQQQQQQLGGSSGVATGRKIHNSSSTSSSSSSTSLSSLCSTSSTLLNKANLQIHTLKTVPMPQTKQYSQQQQIIQHTSHSTSTASTTSNPQHHLHQPPQHVQQINLAPSTLHHQTQHHHSHQQLTPTTHMIQVSEEFLEQAANSHNTGNMMISTTGEVINQQQIFKIVSTDGTTGNMIIDATNQNANSTTTTSKVLLSNLTVLSKQQATTQGQIIGNNHQQQPQTAGQTINFVNAKNLYTTSTSGGNVAGGGKQQKFTVATANVGNYKGSAIKQTSSANSQYLQQPNTLGQHKINMTVGNRNMQMLTTTRAQNAVNSNTASNVANNNSIAVITNSAVSAQTMVLQQPQKFITNNAAGSKMTTTTSNAAKKSAATGPLRANNGHSTVAATKLMSNLQTTQGVKTFITQTSGVQQQTQQNINQLTLQHHTAKGGSKSKFVKQYSNAILNSAGAVAIATLPHQQSNSQNNLQFQQQQNQQLQPQTTYINHHKNSGGSTKINKINSKYAQSVNMTAQLPPGTQLHQKSINQSQQQQFQTTNCNSNIKFVNAQGTVIQQQSLTPQKINNKHQHHQQQYQNLQNFDTVDGNNLFNQATTNQPSSGMSSAILSGTTTLPLATSSGSSLLTDDIMMVNGTQMTDELSARILQSMSQKSFSNQRYQQQQQNVFQAKASTTPPSSINSNSNNNNCNSNNNMLPPPPCTTQNTIVQANNNSNILLSPREYTLYPTTSSTPTVGIVAVSQQAHPQQQQNYNNSATPTASVSSNITAGSFSSNNYITVSNNTNSMTTITPHTSGISVANGVLCSTTICGSTNTVRQAQSAPGSRSQSMERKLHESSMSRKSTEYYKVNNHNSLRGSSHHNSLTTATASVTQTSGNLGMVTGNMSASASNIMGSVVPTSTLSSPLPMPRPSSLPPAALIMEPQAQVIHLQATKTLPGVNNSSNDDDDIIGEEIRPAPVDTDDIRLRILHAVLFDHTYVNPMPMELPTSFAVNLPPASNSSTSSTSSSITKAAGHGQQWSLGGIGAISSTASGGVLHQNYNTYGTQSLNNSSITGDIDPGEETETAPEAELEDDSVTRCICDLTHDDGYMICCDKCCAWQHVDCMGIDRQNIPDEYLCELCQPRIVDKARARSLQLMKRKEQQQQLMLTAQAHASVSAGTIGAASSANVGNLGAVANLLNNDVLVAQQRLSVSGGGGFSLAGSMAAESAAMQLLAPGGSNMKKSKILKKVKDSMSGKRSKKGEKLALATAASLNASSKPVRKETKKNTKRKKASTHDGGSSTVGMTAAEKHAANLRQWIENYELAVTNHYSPELRARLHAISKQPSLLQSILNTENPILKDFSNGSLENRASTVPHAGGKILISNLDIIPNSPICELRGKYMLTTQYKTQNTSMNMNSPPPNNYHLGSYKAHKTPGPFIFFYQLPGTEVSTSCQQLSQTTTTTSLNPDGTYTTTTTTLPAQQSPPTFLKGPEICVDTRTYGNEARFVRRSCRPNAEIQHLFEKGTIHLFIVALTDIRASTEITIRHEPHDLLAVDNKKSSSMVIQPTSTPCACGLTKDCIFGPPIPHLPPAAKSNAGRKLLAHAGGASANAGNLTAKQRKANQQNLNRNRSISSSASGDSNMGVTVVANTVGLSLNSPNNVSKVAPTNKIANNNTLMPLTASCNSNLSNASSTSSALTTITHDSGICTSSSSPSVSLPSPTPHMHSPIQQQQQLQQQQIPQQLLHNTQMRSTVHLLPQQQQLLQSLPTPLVLASPNTSHHQQQQQQQQQQNQQQSSLQQPTMIIQKQQQSLIGTAQASAVLKSVQDDHDASDEKHPQTSLCPLTQPTIEQPPNTLSHSIHQKLLLQEQQHQVQPQPTKHSDSVATVSAGLLETASQETTIAAAALQSLNTSQPPNATLPASSLAGAIVETQLKSPQIQQQQQFLIVPTTENATEQLQQSPQQQGHASANAITTTSTTNPTPSPQRSQQQSPLQQHKSPQKNNNSQNSNIHTGRKTPGKHGRTTSFSEDHEHHDNEDNCIAPTPTFSSTPKEKPKLSREDRKMEAILRAIEKMERNQQKQKQTKRQSTSSQNTTPTSPNKTSDSGENLGGTKRGNSHGGTAGRSKKKRRAGAKGGQGGGYNNQRKRRQSRMNSQESVEESNQQEHDAVTSESDGCNAMHSPPIQTIASIGEPQFSTSTSSSVAGSITTTPKLSAETTNNVDQAAGLLMAFANPNISSSINSSVETAEHHLQQSPQRSSSQYIPSIDAVATSPPTPPSQVSSACLLIEAAVGPLEPNLDGNNSEFKYPLQAKTKKHLMNNWLHQVEDKSSDNNASVQTPHLLQTPVSSEVCNSAAGVSVGSGGLDSLLQAAMSDLKQTHSDPEQPQNLCIAAQKVEEFIQQTEASSCGAQTTHSYEYEQHHQRQITYINLPTPAVDLTLKTPLTIGPNLSSEVTNDNRNFHLPLQVSTCSNNSSVKKRWLRQAISEETHEEFQQTLSMSPSLTAAVVGNTFSNSAAHTSVTFSPATLTNYVPNGFTTPLKKRRLLLTGKDESDENVSQSYGDICANSTPSPSPEALTEQQHHQFNTLQHNELPSLEIEKKEVAQELPSRDTHEDTDIDVEKCETNETQVNRTEAVAIKSELQQDLQYSKIEMDQEQDVDVTTSPQEGVPLLQDEPKTIIKHENDVSCAELKQDSVEIPTQQIKQSIPAEFNDQEDDVDILRSPSPGREMIKAEDNLVKIEPEDISGMDDVKIDVEREESMAADDDVVTQHKKQKADLIAEVHKEDERNNAYSLKKNNVEIKSEFQRKENLNIDEVKESKVENCVDLELKTEDDLMEPKCKRIKTEKYEMDEQKLISVKKEHTAENAHRGSEICITSEICAKAKLSQKQEIVSHSTTKEDEKVLKAESTTREYNAMAEVTSSTSSTLLAVNSVAADTTFDDVEANTPPPLPTPTMTSVGGTPAPIQRHKSLSDDDIQARLHSFHKENILFLQSRNKKTKSSSLISNPNSSSSCLTNNNDHHKSRTASSSSSSSNHQPHYTNHHQHNYHEKSDKSNLKHHKNSPTISGATKKQKVYKRERTASSSSSNSHKNSANPQTPSSSSSLNKNAVVNSTSTSSGSSKKLKSLKKSSSESSTSSNASLSSHSASALVPNCYPVTSSTTTPTTNLNIEKERSADKDKHHRQRTTSCSSNNVSSSNFHVTPAAPFHSSKKRQLNFELELTKDMHLLNSSIMGGSKHKKETSRLQSDEQSHIAAKKSRKEATMSQKEDLKNKHARIEKQQDKKNSGTTSTKQSVGFNSSTSSQSIIVPVTNTPVSTTRPTPIAEHKLIPTIVSQPSLATLAPTPILREHPTIPHFNNVVVGTSSSVGNHQQQSAETSLIPVQHQSNPPLLSQNIPNHVNSPSFIPSALGNHNLQLQQPPLPPTPPPAGCVPSPLSTPNLNCTSHLPFYNTIYGKLLDNSPPSSVPTQLTPSNIITPSSPVATTSVQTGGGVLSEYLDTKLKSYNTLGGYVSHTALFGLNNAAVIKDLPASPSVVSSSTITAHIKENATEMPAPHSTPSAVCGSSTTSCSSGNSAMISLKIHTKTASHDPRLNPQLTAPEPPPQPKRKLSINEYRKRMQQSSSHDSNTGSGSLTTTPTTPPASLEPSLHLGSMMPSTNKCTLNSPDRLTQSVDSQIQKEIMSTTSAVTSSSLDSLNSSNSSTCSNDTLLKSSSFVEEDSTKGQFNAAPTLLEKQQESLCARLKSLKEKQSLVTSFNVGSGNRSRFSSFSESVASGDFGLRREDEEMDIIRNRNLSISSSIGGGDLLDNCLEEISSTSTSISSSREPSPDRCYTTTRHKILAASAASTMTTTSSTIHSNNGETSKHHYKPHINCDKNELSGMERKKSLDIA